MAGFNENETKIYFVIEQKEYLQYVDEIKMLPFFNNQIFLSIFFLSLSQSF